MKPQYLFTLLLATLLFAACTPTSPDVQAVAQSGPQAWIDSPENNSPLPFAQVEIVSHATDASGIVQVELSINGAVIRTDPSPDTAASLITMRQQWQPAAPGTYTLSVRAQGNSGAWGSPSVVVITVGDSSTPVVEVPVVPPTETITPTPAPEITISPTPTNTKTPTATPTFTPVPPTITPTFTALPAGSLNFAADATSLTAGQCTNLTWSSRNIQAVFLEGGSVAASGALQICPPATITYTLSGTALNGQALSRQVTITVTAPAAYINLSADSTSLNAGQCTNLHWDSGNIQSIYLNNEGVTGTETRQVCPSDTTTYTLLANYSGGQLTKQVTITVTGPSLPAPSFFAASWNVPLFNNNACDPSSVTITQPISNAASATIFFSVPGASASKPMNQANSNTWTVTINYTDIPNSTANTGPFTFHVVASNSTGSAQGPTYQQITFSNCKP